MTVTRVYLTHTNTDKANKMNLISRSTPAAQNEPSVPHMRDQVRNATRVCLIKNLNLDDTVYQVQKATSFSPLYKALAIHFYKVEAA